MTTKRRPAMSVEQYWMGGEKWGRYLTDRGEAVTMYRRRQAVRFYTDDGRQIGPEQSNVAPGIAYAMVHGWADAR